MCLYRECNNIFMLSFYREGRNLIMLICLLFIPFKIMNFVTSWTVPFQAPLSMGFPRQEYLNSLPLPSPGDLPKPGIKPGSLATPALTGRLLTTVQLGSPPILWIYPCWCLYYSSFVLINISAAWTRYRPFLNSIEEQVRFLFVCLL